MSEAMTFDLSDMLALGASLRNAGQGAASMEEVATRVVEQLYGVLGGTAADPALALARFYVTSRYADLDATLQSAARAIIADERLTPATRCLVLLATRGARAEWNSRHTSVGHRAIPLPDPEFVARLPMVAAVFNQFGLAPSRFLAEDTAAREANASDEQFRVFLVERAEGASEIPAQAQFVEPMGVRSVLAFGGLLPGGDLFIVLLFSRVPIARDVADLFGPLALSVKLAVLPFVNAPILSPAAAAASTPRSAT